MEIVNTEDLEATQNIIYITEEEHRSEWTYDATKELLKLYDEKSDMLETGIITTQKRLWELTSKALAKKGYYYTGPQCENKWKALKRSYKAKLERMEKFGRNKMKSCPFEQEIYEILSKKPNDSITRSYSLKINEIRKQEDLFSINLNDPPGFGKLQPGNTFHLKQENVDIKNETFDHGKTEISPAELQTSDNGAETITFYEESSQAVLVDEIADLKKIIYKYHKVNTQILQQTTEVQEKIYDCLENTRLTQTKALNLEQTRITQQDEVIRQMKIQNALLQKLVDKLS